MRLPEITVTIHHATNRRLCHYYDDVDDPVL
jgi:hypothetical protein